MSRSLMSKSFSSTSKEKVSSFAPVNNDLKNKVGYQENRELYFTD